MAEPDRYRVFKTSTDYCMYYKNMLLTILSTAINANANS